MKKTTPTATPPINRYDGPVGLRQRILQAASKAELDMLQLEGLRMEHASEKTRLSWARAAARRIKELGAL